MESEIARELIEMQKVLSIQLLAHTQIMSALLNTIGPHDLQRLKKILEVQASSGELQGLTGDSCQLALQIVSLSTEEGATSNPRNFLRLLPSGKKVS